MTLAGYWDAAFDAMMSGDQKRALGLMREGNALQAQMIEAKHLLRRRHWRYQFCNRCDYREGNYLTDAQRECDHEWVEVTS